MNDPVRADEMLVCIDCGRFAQECEPELASVGGLFLPTGAWLCPVCRCKRDLRADEKSEGVR